MNLTVAKSIIGSLIIKLGASAISLVTVPILMNLLGKSDYAVWVTTTALVAWLNLFDFGSGYSLKNKVTESLATNEKTELNTILAGTIQFYVFASLIIAVVFFVSLFFIPVFQKNTLLAITIYLPIICSFPLTLGHFIIQGRKKFNLFNFFLFAQSALWLFVVVLNKYNVLTTSLYRLGLCYSLLFAITNFALFWFSLKGIGFKIKSIFNLNHIKASKDSLAVGYRFFFLQISSLFLFSLGNILTYNNLTLENVAEYDTVNKVFLMGMTLFNVAISVFWAEISHAKAQKNKAKLIELFNQLLLIALGFTICALLFSYFIPQIILIWTKGMIKVQYSQIIPFLLLLAVQSFAYVGAVILNAYEELKWQILLSLFSAILIIPLAKLFFNLKFGIGTVPLASAILVTPTLIYALIKAKSVINQV